MAEPSANHAAHSQPQRGPIVDTMLPKCQCLQEPLELMAYLRKALVSSEDAKTFFLEVLKFITTVALIIATGVVLLMMG